MNGDESQPRLVIVIAAALAACDSSAPPDCKTAIGDAASIWEPDSDVFQAVHLNRCINEKWAPSIRSCIAAARTPKQFDRCMLGRKVPSGGHRRNEAELNLDAIRKSAAAYFAEQAHFPKASEELTPSTPCCSYPSHRCPSDASLWNGVRAWDDLDFEIVETSAFQYLYKSDGLNYIARAIGDEDCDGQVVTWELSGTVVGEAPITELYKFNVE